MRFDGKRAALLALGALAVLVLTGCRFEYHNTDVPIPGTEIRLSPMLVWFAFFFFTVIGPVATILMAYRFYFKRRIYKVAGQDTSIELYTAQRKFPVRARAVLVPVAPDLKMVFGVAKMIRDYGADAIQYEADRVAPLPPGEAFLGTGARYRCKHTILAVIFDEQKRTSPELIRRGIRNALILARKAGVQSIIIPDMTENLLQQPNWITEEQRGQTAAITARTIIEAIIPNRGIVKSVRIWVWDPNNAPYYLAELKKLEEDDSIELAQACNIRDVTVTIVQGDGSDLSADALVRPGSTRLAGGHELVGAHNPADSAIPAAETRAAATAVAERERVRETAHFGDAVLMTNNVPPNVRAVLHLACREPGRPATLQGVRNSVLAALALAEQERMYQLIIPNLGAGENDLEPADVAPLIVDAIADYLNKVNRNSRLEQIYLLAATDEEDGAFARAIERFLPIPIPIPPAPEEHH